jgi:hypothetical protein
MREKTERLQNMHLAAVPINDRLLVQVRFGCGCRMCPPLFIGAVGIWAGDPVSL